MANQHSLVHLYDPPSVAEPNIIYSHIGEAVQDASTRLIYISGQIGEHKTHGLAKTEQEQVSLALENLASCLDTAGATVRDVLNLTFFVVTEDPMSSPCIPLLLKFLNGHKPTSTCVPVKNLATPGAIFEINAVAVVRNLAKLCLPQLPLHRVEWDVIVVGAGLSGLQAAMDCQKAGLSCLVLEAQDRVGGKTLSVPGEKGRGVVDLGAAFVNDTNQSKVAALAKRLGLDLVVQDTVGKSVVQNSGEQSQAFEASEFASSLSSESQELLGKMEVLSLSLGERLDQFEEYDSVNLEQFIRSQGYEDATVATAATLTRAVISQEPRDLSSLSWLRYCHNAGGLLRLISSSVDGAQHMRFRKGSQSLCHVMVGRMIPGSVLTSSPVTSISQRDDGVQINTGNGDRFRCRRIVISVPSTMYEKIEFNPQLPEEKLQYCRGVTMGHNTKAVLIYDEPWWRSAGLSGEARSATGPITVTLDSSVDADEQYSLTGFIAGDQAKSLAKLPGSEQHAAVIGQIKDLFGHLVTGSIPEPSQMFLHNWNQDEWLQGAPCPMAQPQILSKYAKVVREPFENVHFVGTETAEVWTGYMDGALRSGARGAEEVISALRTKST